MSAETVDVLLGVIDGQLDTCDPADLVGDRGPRWLRTTARIMSKLEEAAQMAVTEDHTTKETR